MHAEYRLAWVCNIALGNPVVPDEKYRAALSSSDSLIDGADDEQYDDILS
jgi:hypothetical protein